MEQKAEFNDAIGYLQRLDAWIWRTSKALRGGITMQAKYCLEMFLFELLGQVKSNEREEFKEEIQKDIDKKDLYEAYMKLQNKYHDLGLGMKTKDDPSTALQKG